MTAEFSGRIPVGGCLTEMCQCMWLQASNFTLRIVDGFWRRVNENRFFKLIFEPVICCDPNQRSMLMTLWWNETSYRSVECDKAAISKSSYSPCSTSVSHVTRHRRASVFSLETEKWILNFAAKSVEANDVSAKSVKIGLFLRWNFHACWAF